MDRFSADSHCPDCFKPIGSQSNAGSGARLGAESGAGCAHCGFDQAQAVDGAQYLAPFTAIHNGRYLLGRILGHPGAYGVVYAGWHQRLGREVAIKEFFPAAAIAERSRDHRSVRARPGQQTLFDRWRGRFLNEARLLAGFNHAPRIVQVSDVFEENGSAYLVMERLRGESLSQTLRLQAGERGLQAQHTLQISEAEILFVALLEALGTLHDQQVLHRDISPANLFLRGAHPDGLTLLDFGLARDADAGPVQTGSVGLGTPGFVAPEQLQRDHAPLGPWSDLYSAAAVLYLSLSGSPPAAATKRAAGTPLLPIRRLRPDLPTHLADQIDRCLRLDPTKRPQSAASVREQLTAVTLMPPALPATSPPALADDLTPPAPTPASKPTAATPVPPTGTAAKHLASSSPVPVLPGSSSIAVSKPDHASIAAAIPAIIAEREQRSPATPAATGSHPNADHKSNRPSGQHREQRKNRRHSRRSDQKKRRWPFAVLLLLLAIGAMLWPTLKPNFSLAPGDTPERLTTPDRLPPTSPPSEEDAATSLAPPAPMTEVDLISKPRPPLSDQHPEPPGRIATGQASTPPAIPASPATRRTPTASTSRHSDTRPTGTGGLDETAGTIGAVGTIDAGKSAAAAQAGQPSPFNHATPMPPLRTPTSAAAVETAKPATTTVAGTAVSTASTAMADTGTSHRTTSTAPATAPFSPPIVNKPAAPQPPHFVPRSSAAKPANTLWPVAADPIATPSRPIAKPATPSSPASPIKPASHPSPIVLAAPTDYPPPIATPEPVLGRLPLPQRRPLSSPPPTPAVSPRLWPASPPLSPTPTPLPRASSLPPQPAPDTSTPLQRRQRQLATLPMQERLKQVLAQLEFDLRNHRYITPADRNLLLDFELLRQLDPQHPQLHRTFWDLIWFFSDATREALDTHDRARAHVLLQRAIRLAPKMRRWQPLARELQRQEARYPLPTTPNPAGPAEPADPPTSWSDPDAWRERPPVYTIEDLRNDGACFNTDDCADLIDELYDRY